MKKLILILNIFIYSIFISGCGESSKSTTPTNSTIIQNTQVDPNIKYYQGVWDACTYSAVQAKESNPITFCLPDLQIAVDEDWRNQTTWPSLPQIDFGYGLQNYSKDDPKFEYYRGIFNICIVSNLDSEGKDKVSDFCITSALQQSLDEKWYEKTDWYEMPKIKFK